MIRWTATLAMMVVALTFAAIAPAATMNLTAGITGTYSIDGLTVQNATGPIFDGQPHIYRVGISTALGAPIAAGESYGAASFDAILGSALSRIAITNANVAANYRPNNPAMTNKFDQNGTPIPTTFAGGGNADLGTANDLLGIVADIDGANLGKLVDDAFAPTSDPRQAIGNPSAFLLGSVFVRWDGTVQTQLSFANVAFSIANINNTPIFGNTVASTIAPVIFPVPEPATFVMLGLGGLGLVAAKLGRRKA